MRAAIVVIVIVLVAVAAVLAANTTRDGAALPLHDQLLARPGPGNSPLVLSINFNPQVRKESARSPLHHEGGGFALPRVWRYTASRGQDRGRTFVFSVL